MKIFDVDQHLCDLEICNWEEKLPGHLRNNAPRNIVHEGVERLWIEGKLFPKEKGFGVGSPIGSKAGGNVSLEKRMKWMETVGIDQAILTPGNLGMAIHAIKDIELRNAVCEIYRDWQLEQVYEAGDHCTAGLLVDPFSLPSSDILKDKKVSCLYMRPTNAQGLHMWDEPIRKVLKLCDETGLPLLLHGGTGYYQQSPISDAYDNYFYSHLFSHVAEIQMGMAELIGHGLFQDYSELRVVFVEAGIYWIPSFIDRLQHHLKRLGKHVPGKGLDVYQVFAQRCAFSVFNDDANGLGDFLARHYWMKAVFGSDFPHWDTMNINSILKHVDGPMKAKIAHQNAEAFFDLNIKK